MPPWVIMVGVGAVLLYLSNKSSDVATRGGQVTTFGGPPLTPGSTPPGSTVFTAAHFPALPDAAQPFPIKSTIAPPPPSFPIPVAPVTKGLTPPPPRPAITFPGTPPGTFGGNGGLTLLPFSIAAPSPPKPPTPFLTLGVSPPKPPPSTVNVDFVPALNYLKTWDPIPPQPPNDPSPETQTDESQIVGQAIEAIDTIDRVDFGLGSFF